MEQKKSSKADLESSKGMFFQLGLIVAISVILVAFEWTSEPTGISDLKLGDEIGFDIEIMVTRREDPPMEQPKPELPKVAEVLNIVNDDVEIPDFDFGNEVDKNTSIDISQWINVGEDPIEDDEPFIVVEDMPMFNGGDPRIEFVRYIAKNLTYPQIASENGIGGKILVQFIVNEKGKVIDAKVLRSVDSALDKEALRVVTSSPLWTPGKQRGKAVKVIYTFPINFVLR